MKNLPIPRIVSKLLKVSFLFLVATSVLSSSAQAGLKLYWNLNENTGTSAGDSSGNSNVGTFPLPPYNGSAPIILGPGIEGSGALVRGYPYAYNGITASNSSHQIFTSGQGSVRTGNGDLAARRPNFKHYVPSGNERASRSASARVPTRS